MNNLNSNQPQSFLAKKRLPSRLARKNREITRKNEQLYERIRLLEEENTQCIQMIRSLEEDVAMRDAAMEEQSKKQDSLESMYAKSYIKQNNFAKGLSGAFDKIHSQKIKIAKLELEMEANAFIDRENQQTLEQVVSYLDNTLQECQGILKIQEFCDPNDALMWLTEKIDQSRI